MIEKCNNCGGGLSFSPKDKGNKCENCGTVFPITYNYNFNKKPFEENKIANNLEQSSLKQVKCSSCGATVILSKQQVQVQCPYCSNTALSVERRTKLMNVDSIIPFGFDKTEALRLFKSKVNGNFFADKNVFKHITTHDINGVYINTFVFDFTTSTSYNGVFSYQRTVKDKEGRTRTERVNKAVNGTLDKFFKNITIEANSNLNQYDLKTIEPFQYASSVEYNDDFMHGYMLEYQDKMFTDCVKMAEKMMEKEIKSTLLNNHGCTDIVSLDMNVTYTDKKYNYCLLPVYFVNTVNPKNGKKHTALMNGQTGKVGKLPSDKLKVFLTVLIACGIFVAFVIAILMFIL